MKNNQRGPKHPRNWWQVATLVLCAVMLMGSGAAALTGSRLIINANNSEGDKVLVRVDGQDVFKITHDGAGTNVTIDPGTGGTVTINEATVNGGTGGGSGLPSGIIVYSNNPNDTGLLAAGFTRETTVDIASATGGTSLTDAPTGRHSHIAVWAETEMLVSGGNEAGAIASTGGRYTPATRSWNSLAGAPNARRGHTAVWTGTEVLFWGGWNGGVRFNTGGRYNPATNTWTPISTTGGNGAPSAREQHTAVWTGTEMLIWGGFNGTILFNDGGRYDPVTDEWTTIASLGAPSARWWHTAVWTGTEMIVWGGELSGGPTNTGGRYNPATNTWAAMNASAPSARTLHTAVWTGTEMIVWGGRDSSSVGVFNTGGRYNPATNTWAGTTTTNAPSARRNHTAVWTGTEMIVWGGWANGTTGTGGRYFPATNTWTDTPSVSAPDARHDHSAVWTGTEMIVWGGTPLTNTGGRYDPSTDAWVGALFAYKAP